MASPGNSSVIELNEPASPEYAPLVSVVVFALVFFAVEIYCLAAVV